MLLSFFFLLGFQKWSSTFSPLNIWSVLTVHMWIKDFLTLSVFASSFSSRAFFEQWTPVYTYISFFCHKQCCLFELPSLAVILRRSRRFVNFIPYLMADPSHPFMSVLMSLVFKGKSLHTLDTNIFSLSNTNTSSVSLSSSYSPSPTPSFGYSDQLLCHDVGERSKLFPP